MSDETIARHQTLLTSLTGLTGSNGRVGSLESRVRDHEQRLRALENVAIKVMAGATVGAAAGGLIMALILQLIKS